MPTLQPTGQSDGAWALACLELAAEPIAVLEAAGPVRFANSAFWRAVALEGEPALDLHAAQARSPAVTELLGALASNVDRPVLRMASGGPYQLRVSRLPDQGRMLTLLPAQAGSAGADVVAAAVGAVDDWLRQGEQVALIYVDVVKLDRINEAFGYATGNSILDVVRERAADAAGPGAAMMPLGGDDFLLMLAGERSAERAKELAADLVELLSRPSLIRGNLVSVDVSIGLAFGPDEAADGATMMRHVRLALGAAQEAGGSCFRCFDGAYERALAERRQLEFDLRRAIKTREFRLFYQAQARVSDGEIAGFEALIRWEHPDRGLLSPAAFVDVAETIGLMPQIGAWVLEQACSDAVQWPRRLNVSVNVSATQFADGRLVEHVRRALSRSGLPAVRLELEITENILLNDTQENLATLNALRDLGCRIALDDFGTGYSSLSYLSLFPFNRLKLDRSFVRRMGTDRNCSAIARTVADLGLKLGMDTVAEGVESREQLAAINAQGFDIIQGYLISKPVPAGRLSDLVPDWPGAEEAA